MKRLEPNPLIAARDEFAGKLMSAAGRAFRKGEDPEADALREMSRKIESLDLPEDLIRHALR